ncbi:glycosyltransferase [Candidatus Saccharibacteria bacterium]|nr:MAG: glycosyltransferase [Candidatus Saccharibacteria bacterium]
MRAEGRVRLVIFRVGMTLGELCPDNSAPLPFFCYSRSMILALCLWLLAAASELLLYKVLPTDKSRVVWAVATGVLLLVSGTWLVFLHWQIWLAVWFLSLYKLLSLARAAVNRLPRRELQRMSVRAFAWLLLAQVIVMGLGWLMVHQRATAVYIFDLLVATQVLAALVVLRVTVNTWRHTQPGDLQTSLTDKELPTVSVLIPARNETDALQRCLETLIASDYPKLEIIVLDDCSVNRRTPEIIRGFAQDGVRFIQGGEPNEVNWLAKNHAYARLSEEASGKILLFCGVDVEFSPHSVRCLVELMHKRGKDMVSVMPLRAQKVWSEGSLLQPMRYFWEICLPRRFFKRPPVLSTVWAIRTEALERAGGFDAVARSVTPEAHFARQSVIGDKYSFIRSNLEFGVYSTKLASEQYETTIRTRYPQLHRRLELVAVTTVLELFFLIGPFLGLLLLWALPHQLLLGSIWLICVVALEATYYQVAVKTKLDNPAFAWLLFPAAVLTDLVMLHVSFWKYEFGRVDWKGRNVCVPVMRVEPHLPKLQ